MSLHRLAGGIILRKGAILLGKRASSLELAPNVWDVFGGHIESSEEPGETLVRELQEELGITPTHFVPLTVLRGFDEQAKDAYELNLYCVTAWKGVPENLQPEEHSAIQWFTIHETQSLELALPAYQALFKSFEENSTSG